MNETKQELKDALGRYQRILGSEEAMQVLDEVDAMFRLDMDIFSVLRTDTLSTKEGLSMAYQANAKDFIVAREGARAYSMVLRRLIERTEEQIKQMENEDE